MSAAAPVCGMARVDRQHFQYPASSGHAHPALYNGDAEYSSLAREVSSCGVRQLDNLTSVAVGEHPEPHQVDQRTH